MAKAKPRMGVKRSFKKSRIANFKKEKETFTFPTADIAATPSPTKNLTQNVCTPNSDSVLPKKSTFARELKNLDWQPSRIDDRWQKKNPNKTSGNRIIDFDSLSHIITNSCCCNHCGSAMKVREKTVGIATCVEVSCTDMNCKNKGNRTHCKRTQLMDNCKYGDTAESFAINCTFVLGVQQFGGGASESDIIITYLNLPHAHGFHRHSFQKIEAALRPTIKSVCDEAVAKGLDEEVKLTLNNNVRFQMWKRGELTSKDVKLTVGYDMGWNKRSSGHKYDSTSGHGFLVGGLTKKIVGFKVMSKHCNECNAWTNNDLPVPPHDCTKNHVGTSKSMETEAIFRLVTEAYFNRCFCISVIISDDDSTMKANLRHSWRELIDNGLLDPGNWPRTAGGAKKKIMSDSLWRFRSPSS